MPVITLTTGLPRNPPDSVEIELAVVHETCLSGMESFLYIENISTAVRSASPFRPLAGVLLDVQRRQILLERFSLLGFVGVEQFGRLAEDFELVFLCGELLDIAGMQVTVGGDWAG